MKDSTRHQALGSGFDAYGRAWETKDPSAAGDLFMEDATYRETPFGEPVHWCTGIEEYWSRVTRVQDEISFEHEVLVDTEEAGITKNSETEPPELPILGDWQELLRRKRGVLAASASPGRLLTPRSPRTSRLRLARNRPRPPPYACL